jgi:outer membrane immunogenic protein
MTMARAATRSPWQMSDLPSRAPPPVYLPPPPIFTWTGVYVGGQIGYAWGRDSVDISFPGFGVLDSFRDSPQGVIGGAHVGYNLQINQWVIGLEGTVDGTSLSKSFTPGGFFSVVQFTTRSDIQGSIRGRAGIAFDRALIYATGGVAFAGIENNYLQSVQNVSESFSKTRVGWTVGGGIEYAVTNNWSVRAEYRYSDFGRFTDSPFAAAPGGPLSVRHHLTENQVQAGFSYKFDTWAPYPVVAKY